jgi:hypothetical protein
MRRLAKALILIGSLACEPALAQNCGPVSNCPSATTPLGGNEFIYLVQNGKSTKTTVSQVSSTLAIPSTPAQAILYTQGVTPPLALGPLADGVPYWQSNGTLSIIAACANGILAYPSGVPICSTTLPSGIVNATGLALITPANTADFNTKIASAISAGQRGVQLVPGSYTVSLTGTGATSGLPYALLVNTPSSDFTIDGQGSTITLNSAQTTPGSGTLGQNYAQILQLTNAPSNSTITLKNLTLKYSVPPEADAELTACTGTTATFRMQGAFAPDWPSVTRIDQYNPTAVAGATFGATVGSGLFTINVYSNSATPITMTNAGSGNYTLALSGSGLTCGSFTVNNYYRLISLQFGYSAIGFYQVGNIVLDNVRVVNAAGQAETVVGAGNVQLVNGTGTYRAPGTSLATNAGGYAGIYESGIFSSDPTTHYADTGDDALFIAPYSTTIVSAPSRTSITIQGVFPNTYVKNGDTLQFILPTTGTYEGSAIVSAVVVSGANTVLTLSGTGAPSGVSSSWIIYDQSQAPGVAKIDGGFFANTPTRGIFIDAAEIEIDSPHVANTGSAGILSQWGFTNIGVIPTKVTINNPILNNINYANDAATGAIDNEGWCTTCGSGSGAGVAAVGTLTQVNVRDPDCSYVGSACVYMSGVNNGSAIGGSLSNWYQLATAPAYAQSGCSTVYTNAFAFCNDTNIIYGLPSFLTSGNQEGETGVSTLTSPTLALSSIVGFGTGVATALGDAVNASGGVPTVPVANAQLANAATTVAGQICTLGSSCAVASSNLSDAGAWTTYTPTPSCGSGSGTWGTVTGRYKTLLGKITHVWVDAVLTTVGTCATNVQFTLPVNAVSATGTQIVYGRENNTTGDMLQGTIATGAGSVIVTGVSNGFIGGNGYIYLMSGSYENQ